eukprot:149323-Rhodomonas_salina.2
MGFRITTANGHARWAYDSRMATPVGRYGPAEIERANVSYCSVKFDCDTTAIAVTRFGYSEQASRDATGVIFSSGVQSYQTWHCIILPSTTGLETEWARPGVK